MHRRTGIPGPSVKSTASSLSLATARNSCRRRQEPASMGQDSFIQQRMPAVSQKTMHQGAFSTNYAGLLKEKPPPISASLLKGILDKENVSKKKERPGPGKVKIMLRIVGSGAAAQGRSEWLRVESNKKHVSVFSLDCGSSQAQRDVNQAAKLYAFDSVFTDDTSLEEICTTSLVDVLQAVLNGADGTVFCYGQANLGKTFALLGDDDGKRGVGLIPCNLSWLYRCIKELNETQNRRITVSVSSLEVYGTSEKLRDLLASYCEDGPSGALCIAEDPLIGTQIQNQCEIPAATSEQAAYLLDAALASRSCSGTRNTHEQRRHSHMVFSLNLYEEKANQNGRNADAGIYSRLHFIDLGSCEKNLIKSPNSLALSLSSLGHVLMAIINNSKHVPFRQSKLTCVLRNCLGNYNCRTVMIAHVSKDRQHHADAITTIQLISRIHRVLRKRNRPPRRCDESASVGYGAGARIPRSNHLYLRSRDEESLGSSSGMEYTSGSELSCDTVVYVDKNGMPVSDRELTDNEGPPQSAFISTKARSSFIPSPTSGGAMVYNVSEAKVQDLYPVTNSRQLNRHDAHVALREYQSEVRFVRQEERTQSGRILSSVAENGGFVESMTKSPLDAKTQPNRLPKPIKPPRSTKYSSDELSHDLTARIPVNYNAADGASEPLATSDNRAAVGVRSKPPGLQANSLKNERFAAGSNLSGLQLTGDSKQPSPGELLTSLPGSNEDKSQFSFSRSAGVPQALRTDFSKCNGISGFSKRSQVDDENDSILPKDTSPEKHLPGEVRRCFSVAARPEPDGCDQPCAGRKPPSNCKVTTDRRMPCFESDFQLLKETRPDSMFVNVDDRDWQSPESDDSLIDNNDKEAVGIKFYCLTFTSRNPLMPMSQRKFSQEIKKCKEKKGIARAEQPGCRLNAELQAVERANARMVDQDANNAAFQQLLEAEQTLEELVTDATNLNIRPTPEIDEMGSLKDAGFVPGKTDCNSVKGFVYPGESESQNSKGSTALTDVPPVMCSYVNSVNQQMVIEETQLLLEDADTEKDEQIPQTLTEIASRINSDRGTEPAHRRICLYNSNSLEVDYVSHQARTDSSPSRLGSSSPQPGKRKVMKDRELIRRSSRPVVVTKSVADDGARLTLVKKDTGRRPTLELKITAECDRDSGHNKRPTKLATPKSFNRTRANGTSLSPNDKNDQVNGTSKQLARNSSPSQKLSVWPAIKRFGSRRSQSKSPKRITDETANTLVSKTGIVSKLLTPKVKRARSAKVLGSRDVEQNCTANGKQHADTRCDPALSFVKSKDRKTGIAKCVTNNAAAPPSSTAKPTLRTSPSQHTVPNGTESGGQSNRTNTSAKSRFGFHRKSKEK